MTAARACSLCGGTAGQSVWDRNGGTGKGDAHALCAARAKRGQPTPSMGDRCACCNGSGCHPRSAVGPCDPNQDAIDRWAPACTTCGGTGTIGGAVNHARHINPHKANGCRPAGTVRP